ncbi:hypothetical protein [Niabella aquatica]
MIISHINTEHYAYFKLHAEEVISSNYLNDNNEGIYIRSLQFETVNRVYEHIKSIALNNKYIVLDFEFIDYLQANILDKIVDVRDLGYHLVFINLAPSILTSLSVKTVVNHKNVKNTIKGFDIFYFFSDESCEMYDVEINSRKIFYEEFKSRLKKGNYIVEYNKVHTSSFVYLKSFIDLKKFISHETPFIYFSIYYLAVKLKKKWSSYLDKNPILVGQSLTSAFVVSILSKLLKLQILIFDKIGPITKLYNKLDKPNFENKNYIIVSDLVCLGTEVKITKNLIEFSGGKYLGNISLVKVETLTRDDMRLDNIDRTISVFSVSDKNNIELNYNIYTNLKPS